MNIDRSRPGAETRSQGADRSWNRIEDWRGLEGSFVELRRSDGSIVDRGNVESVTNDGNVIWMLFEGASTRRLHLRVAEIETRALREVVPAAAKNSESSKTGLGQTRP